MSPFGPLLRHPHSLPVGVLVEQGILGFGLLIVSIGVLVVVALRYLLRFSQTFFGPVAAALIVCVGSFTTEYHLISTFAASFVWWFVAFLFLDHQWRRASVEVQGESSP